MDCFGEIRENCRFVRVWGLDFTQIGVLYARLSQKYLRIVPMSV